MSTHKRVSLKSFISLKTLIHTSSHTTTICRSPADHEVSINETPIWENNSLIYQFVISVDKEVYESIELYEQIVLALSYNKK